MEKRLDIFLLIGQSNMAGRGRMNEVSALRHPRIRMFRGGEWLPAAEPLHTDKPEVAGVGLGMSFALDLVGRDGWSPIGLLPCAVGGTPLSRWMPGADLYAQAVAATRAAQAAGELKGILWHQGEADAGSAADADSYGARLRDMIFGLRTELAAGRNIPVVAGELGHFLENFDGCGFFRQVNRQLHELEASLPGFACASADGLGDNGDALHFSAAALREFGVRYARRFLELPQP